MRTYPNQPLHLNAEHLGMTNSTESPLKSGSDYHSFSGNMVGAGVRRHSKASCGKAVFYRVENSMSGTSLRLIENSVPSKRGGVICQLYNQDDEP